MVLETQNISHGYGSGETQVQILRNYNLAIRQGEAVALVAPSGTGKSTLLHLCGLLETPNQGKILIKGKDCSTLSDSAKTELRGKEIGFVYQSHRLLPEFSALENVMLPQRLAGADIKSAQNRAVDLLTRFGLGHRLNHRSAELSGGEQQRVAIARALANRPSLLLADEPTGNLDPKTSEIVFAEFLRLTAEEGVAALIATHNLDLAACMGRTVRMSA